MREVAWIAAALTRYKVTQTPNGVCLTDTPMYDYFNSRVSGGLMPDTLTNREKYLRVARYIGWNVCKRYGRYYENGIEIWHTDGL